MVWLRENTNHYYVLNHVFLSTDQGIMPLLTKLFTPTSLKLSED